MVCISSHRVQWCLVSNVKPTMVGISHFGITSLCPRESQLVNSKDTVGFCWEPWHGLTNWFWASSHFCSLPLSWRNDNIYHLPNSLNSLSSDLKISSEMYTLSAKSYYFDYTAKKNTRDEQGNTRSPPPLRGLCCVGIAMGGKQSITFLYKCALWASIISPMVFWRVFSLLNIHKAIKKINI